MTVILMKMRMHCWDLDSFCIEECDFPQMCLSSANTLSLPNVSGVQTELFYLEVSCRVATCNTSFNVSKAMV